jgi:caffeoyl-CoA O-methyltransferase
MGFTDKAVERYLKDILPERDEILNEIEARALREKIPIVGPVVGRFLEQLALMVNARRVFEMGSAVGYSTIWWARAVGPGGTVYYSDGSSENASDAKEYISRAGLIDRVRLMTGNSLDLIDQTDGEFDIVFNDVDKHYYPEVYRRAADRVRVGGLLVADNVLWGGDVADPGISDRDTAGIREFNTLIYDDPRYMTTIMPVRDGVLVARRME